MEINYSHEVIVQYLHKADNVSESEIYNLPTDKNTGLLTKRNYGKKQGLIKSLKTIHLARTGLFKRCHNYKPYS